MDQNCIIIGVAGGSASGKTTVARKLMEAFEIKDAVMVEQDAYYKDVPHKSIEERAGANFDHPDSIEFLFFKNTFSI